MVSFFDSYGGFPDNQKHHINEDFLAQSGQKYNKLALLLLLNFQIEDYKTLKTLILQPVVTGVFVLSKVV